jgi:hypothetical protein
VSGSPAAVPGYQRTLVALAGPVPGILLGLVLVFVYALGHSSMVGEAAKMFLGLNAFNLLPLLPLDGAHGAALVLAFIGGAAFFAAQSYAGVADRPSILPNRLPESGRTGVRFISRLVRSAPSIAGLRPAHTTRSFLERPPSALLSQETPQAVICGGSFLDSVANEGELVVDPAREFLPARGHSLAAPNEQIE